MHAKINQLELSSLSVLQRLSTSQSVHYQRFHYIHVHVYTIIDNIMMALFIHRELDIAYALTSSRKAFQQVIK